MKYLIGVIPQIDVATLDKPFYYCFNDNIEIGSRVLISFNNNQIIGLVILTREENSSIEEINIKYNINVIPIIKVLDKKPLISGVYLKLAKYLARKHNLSLAMVFSIMLPFDELNEDFIYKNPFLEEYLVYKKDNLDLNKKDLNKLNIIKKAKEIRVKDFNKTYQKLLETNCIEVINKENLSKINLVLDNKELSIYETLINNEKINYLIKANDAKHVNMINLFLIKNYLKNKESAVFIYEDENTARLAFKFYQKYFGIKVVLYSEDFIKKKRLYAYQAVANQDFCILIGTKKALYLPLNNLRHVIVNNSEDINYIEKIRPYINLNEIIEFFSLNENINIIKYNKCPDVIDYYNATKGINNFKLLEINNNGNTNTKYKCINEDIKNMFNDESIINSKMMDLIKKALYGEEKLLILFNRPGDQSLLACDKCNSLLRCNECGKPLFYSSLEKKVVCISCNNKMDSSNIKCKVCGNSTYKSNLYGIERMYRILTNLSQDSSLIYLKAKNSTLKNQGEALNKSKIVVANYNIDDLMNYNKFKNVLILDFDNYLNYKFTNTYAFLYNFIEKIRSLLSVNELGHNVIFQFKSNDTLNLINAINNDYLSYFQRELEAKRVLKLAPFSYVFAFTFEYKKNNKTLVINDINILKNILKNIFINSIYDSYLTKEQELYKNNFTLSYIIKAITKEEQDKIISYIINCIKPYNYTLSINYYPHIV